MNISAVGLDLIKRFEGLRLKAYKAVSTEKYYTIGYGHYGSDVKEGMVITQQQADEYLKKDVASAVSAVNNTSLILNQFQFDALVSFTFNCGKANLTRLIKNRTLDEISNAILLYNKSGGKVLQGLVNRRKAEKELFDTKVVSVNVVKGKSYTVVKGDTLSSISKKVYGTTSKWRVIYNANLDIIKNPNLIRVGWELVIPNLVN